MTIHRGLGEVWSGGQIGSDIAGLRAAASAGLRTGGWIPRGFRTRDGSRPEYAELYGLAETATTRYPERTKANVLDCEATFLLGDNPDSPGCALTRYLCEELGKPCLAVTTREMDDPSSAARAALWLQRHNVERLNVAGNRNAPEDLIEAWLRKVFEIAR